MSLVVNLIVLRIAKTLWSFGLSECNTVNKVITCLLLVYKKVKGANNFGQNMAVFALSENVTS